MFRTLYHRTRLACAYFFFGAGLAYGIFTARLPAYKAITGADDGDIGMLLFAFGIFSLLALSTASFLIGRFGLGRTLAAGYALMCLGWLPAGLCASPLALALPLAVAGLGTGICDVAMNAEGIETEQHFHVHCMSFLHASFSLGGVLGAAAGSIFAAWGIGPLGNTIAILAPWLLLLPVAAKHLLPGERMARNTGKKNRFGFPPLVVLFCGLLTMLAYMAEGSVGEWGSIFLHSERGASPELAALVFSAFSTPMVIGRLLGDGLRDHFGATPLLFMGATLGAVGMAVAIFSPWAGLALVGYAIMGMGMAPVVPILFSLAGSRPGVNVAQAASVVSTMAYSGMLFFPPLLGFLGNNFGLGNALLIPLMGCAAIALGAIVLGKGAHVQA